MKEGLGLVFGLALGCLAIFGIGYGSWAMYNFFAPKYEQTRYNTFKQSQSYNEGMVRELSHIMVQYQSATPDQKAALKELAIQQFQVYPYDSLPPNLQAFYSSLQNVN